MKKKLIYFKGQKVFLFTVFLFILIATINFSYAGIINIPSDFVNIQDGIVAASEADTVLVGPGTYVENIDFLGKSITVASKYLTTQDSSYIEQTTINGGIVTSVVKFVNGEDSTSVICGFTLNNGSGTEFPPFTGGGITCRNSSPVIMNMIVMNNVSYYGGGLYTENASPTVLNTTLINNIASGHGGGAFFYDNSFPNLENVSIIINNSYFYGAGVCCYYYSSPTFKNVIIANNHSSDIGGGLYCENFCNPVLDNVTIVKNSAELTGGAVYCYGNSLPIMTNCIISDNIGDYGFYIDSGNPSISFSTLYNNGDDNLYGDNDSIGVIVDTNANNDSCDVYNNIFLEPCYVDMMYLDFHLFPNSPCIDAGDPESPLDPDSTVADMGALYFNQNQAVNEEHDKILENCLLLYPNPISSNENIKLKFVLQNSGKVKMSLFNVKGQLIENIINNELNSGEHILNKSLKDLQAGMYFINMYLDGKSRGVQKMVVIK